MNLILRRQKILEQLESHGTVEVKNLATLLDASEVTVRADLRTLEQEGKLIRFFGGAQLPESSKQTVMTAEPPVSRELKDEVSISSRYSINSDEKVRIAKRAAELVPANATIILDSGSTTHLVAEELTLRGNITAITNNLSAAIALSDSPNTTLVICGGVYRPKTQSMHGQKAEQCLDGVSADFLFIGADGLDPKRGITTFNEGYNISRVMANCATKIVAVVDSSKFTRAGFNQVLDIEQIDILITDTGIQPETKTQFQQAGLQVITV
ncbi:transcriptional regulator [Vibrio sp. HA2012]|uniref:DeoR/GlpR family DNA-binding transcription regulator n=1 Tax=Vibrio sp. HA2012 TaxID=1971595 RepID=UPI000C2B9651|nr:DeoR/GlpR family DNA-binding transcription regulator [Vibrio sp. HA2012]PJC86788.1 transcriptional regulator [Vibrio sp. HA2012]